VLTKLRQRLGLTPDDPVVREYDAQFGALSARLEQNIAQVIMSAALFTFILIRFEHWRRGGVTVENSWLALGLFLWYATAWYVIRRGHYAPWVRYVGATMEVSVPSIALLFQLRSQDLMYLYTTPALLLYPLAVSASALRLDPRLCLYAGIFGSSQFLLLFGLVIPRDDARFTGFFSVTPVATGLKAAYILGVGIFGAVAALVMQKLLLKVTRTAVERERVRGLFGVYVSEAVVEQILADQVPEGGERRRVSVCATDIRGFTTLSEERPPEEVVKLLNRYFERMCEVVARHGGVVNKFIGDGMLVMFNAPNRVDDDARRACACARAMVEEAERLFRTGEFPGLKIGVGICRGDCVVGNVGGTQRREYTAIGDVVNTAFRIEGLTKILGQPIVVTRDVRDAMGAEGETFELLGAHHVKGREALVELYGVSAPAPSDAPAPEAEPTRPAAGR